MGEGTVVGLMLLVAAALVALALGNDPRDAADDE